MEPLRILYIASWSRSGSTIVGDILGQVDGVFHGGELWNFGRRGIQHNDLCGCGLPFRECGFWSAVLSGVQRRLEPAELHLLNRLPYDLVRTRQIPSLAFSGRLGLGSEEERMVQTLESVYSRIREVSGAKVIVDSSKSPVYARLLGRIPGIQMAILHLVRDPRATSYSWSRAKLDPAGDRYLPQHGPVRNGVMWSLWNAVIELWWGRDDKRSAYTRVRYEDFLGDPARIVREALGLIGMDQVPLVFLRKREVDIARNHTMAGNPSRLLRGPVAITANEEWRGGLPIASRAVLGILTWPLLLRYAYPLVV